VLINENIRVKEVRLIGPEGEQVGIMPTRDALEYAYDHGVDLVMIAPVAEPPVCRAIDYGKFRFEKDKREKEAKKNQQVAKVKEVQLSCKIDTHDFNTRLSQAIKFLQGGDKVKVSIRFMGREMAHQQIGVQVVERFMEAIAEYGTSDKKPTIDGRFVSVLLTPVKATGKATK
jgi:translation initiation factor IF-3